MQRLVLGRYELVGRLGSGAMGEVFLAQDVGPTGLGRLVAVRTIHVELASQAEVLERFLDDARLAAQIRHPHVVPVFDLGIDEGRPFLVMEYVPGDSLGELMRQFARAHESFPHALLAHLGSTAAEALHAAHETASPDGERLGLVHRGLAPKNILLGFDGQLRLIDFGFGEACAHPSGQDAGGQPALMAYMAPEQLANQPQDRRVDVFALGIVLYEMVALRRLFRAETPVITKERVLRGQIPPLTLLEPDCPPLLATIIAKALAREPEKRWQTARELGDALTEASVHWGPRWTAGEVERCLDERLGERKRAQRELEKKAGHNLASPDRTQLSVGPRPPAPDSSRWEPSPPPGADWHNAGELSTIEMTVTGARGSLVP